MASSRPCSPFFSRFPYLGAQKRTLVVTCAFAVLLGCSALSGAVQAQASQEGAASREYAISANTLSDALAEFSAKAGVQLVFEPGILAGLKSPGLHGRYGVEEGFSRLLNGSGYMAIAEGDRAYSLRAISDGTRTLEPVSVTGTAPSRSGKSPVAYAGGQVATGGRLGMLGDTDFMDAPFSITSYTSQRIESQQAQSLADVVDDDPSVQVGSRGRGTNTSGGDALYIRGFLVRNQDVSLNGLYGVLPRNTISMQAVERVEVIKGPNALLNGASPWGSVGGGINVVPKRAADEPLTRLKGIYRTDAQLGTHLDVGRRFGEENRFGVRFNGAYMDGDTAVQDQESRLGLATLGVDYRGERLRLSADLGYQKDRTDGGSGFGSGLQVTEGTPVPDAIDPGKRTAQSWERTENKDEYIALHGEYDLTPAFTLYGGAGGRNNTPYNLRTNHTLLDEDTLASMAVYYPEYSDTRTVMSGLRGRFNTGDVTHQLNVQTSMLWFEGGFLYEQGDVFLSELNDIGRIDRPDFSMSRHIPKSVERKLSSVGVSDTLGLLDEKVLLTLGARRQRVEVDNFDPRTRARMSHYDEERTTPAVGIAVRPWQNVTFYGNYIEGLGLGYTAPANAENAGEAFTPARTRQGEMGIKVDGGNLASTVSVFEIRQPSVVQKPGSTPGQVVYTEDGEQRNRGVEWQLFGEPTPALRLLAGVTYLQPILTSTQDGENDGNQAPGVSRWLATVSAEWDVPSLSGLSVNTRVIHSSSQYGDASNTLKIPAWTRVDLGASYRLKTYPVTLRASIENALDKEYWESYSGSGGRLRLAEPRYVTLSTTIDF